jgi:ankyrin repeat protein
MLCASRDGDLDHVMQLVSRRPELSTCQFNYTPPLHFAVREGHVALVRMLLSQGAFDPQYKNYPFGDSLITMAQDRGHDEIAMLLQNALSQPQLTRQWVDTGEINYGQDEEETRFDKAVHDGHLKEVERCLKSRPQLARNEMSSWAEGVLMMPARGGDRPMLELLIRYEAQVPIVSKWGRFYYFKHTDIAAFLLTTGMSASHMSWHHVTLLHDMAQSGDIPKAQLLLDHGADINAIDEEYCSTPLGMAARWGQRDMVAFLLERGADRERAGAAWSSPLAWAQKKGHISIANDLLGS